MIAPTSRYGCGDDACVACYGDEEWRESRDETLYKIIRFYEDWNHPDDKRVMETGLTLEEAQEWCHRDDSHGDGWFDGYEEE